VSAGVLANNSQRVDRYLEKLEAERLKYLVDPDSPDDPQASVEASLRLSWNALSSDATSVLQQMAALGTTLPEELAEVLMVDGAEVDDQLDLLLRRNMVLYDAVLNAYVVHELVQQYVLAQACDLVAILSAYQRYSAALSAVFLHIKSSMKGEVILEINTFLATKYSDEKAVHSHSLEEIGADFQVIFDFINEQEDVVRLMMRYLYLVKSIEGSPAWRDGWIETRIFDGITEGKAELEAQTRSFLRSVRETTESVLQQYHQLEEQTVVPLLKFRQAVVAYHELLLKMKTPKH
jgi:hypothetical protein